MYALLYSHRMMVTFDICQGWEAQVYTSIARVGIYHNTTVQLGPVNSTCRANGHASPKQRCSPAPNATPIFFFITTLCFQQGSVAPGRRKRGRGEGGVWVLRITPAIYIYMTYKAGTGAKCPCFSSAHGALRKSETPAASTKTHHRCDSTPNPDYFAIDSPRASRGYHQKCLRTYL